MITKSTKGKNKVDLFNIICGVCSIVGLLVSIYTAGKVIKISNTLNCGNKDNHSKVVNIGKGNTFNGSYVGRNNINERRSEEHK